MHAPQSPAQLRTEARAHEARAHKLRSRADAISTSGAPKNYDDAADLYEELCAEADVEFTHAMKLYRQAHATEFYARDRRAA